MKALLTVLIYVAAVNRLTGLVVEDEVTRPVREWAYARGGRIAYLFACSRCVSVWAALAVVFVLPRPLVQALALSESVSLVQWTADVVSTVVTREEET